MPPVMVVIAVTVAIVVAVPAMLPVMVIAAIVPAAAARLRQADQLDDIATAHSAAHIALELTAAAFELDIVEADPKAARPKLADPVVVINVDITEAGTVALALDRAGAALQGIAAKMSNLARPRQRSWPTET